MRTSSDTAAGHLPHHQAVAVDVGHDVGLEVVLVHGLVEDLRSHVPSRAHARVQRDVHLIGVTMTTHHNRTHDSTGSPQGIYDNEFAKSSGNLLDYYY